MIAQCLQNNLSGLETFQNVLKDISNSNWKSAVHKANKIYKVKCFNLEKLTPQKVKQIYLKIHNNFYIYNKSKKYVWVENQLRIFIWILVVTSQIKNKSIDEYNEHDWFLLSSIFLGKTIQTCKFQYLCIAIKEVAKWHDEQQKILNEIIEQKEQTGYNWNQVSRDLFNRSSQRYFKTSKQCRQHWNNYLNPCVCKSKWTKIQDFILIKHVMQKGKQWAVISKSLDSKRTQHMVKNRFKSIILSYSKQQGLFQKHTERPQILQKIFTKLKSQCQQLQQSSQQISNHTEYQKNTIIPTKSSFPLISLPSQSDSTTLGLGSFGNLNLFSSFSFQIPQFIFTSYYPLFQIQPNLCTTNLIIPKQFNNSL